MILFHIMAIVCVLLKGAVFSLDWHAFLKFSCIAFYAKVGWLNIPTSKRVFISRSGEPGNEAKG